MAKLPTYTSKNVKITWAGHTFVGLAPDSFIEISPNADVTDEEVGADGSVSISFLPDITGLVTISLQALSPTNSWLSNAVNLQDLEGDVASSNMTVYDPSGSIVAVIYDAHIKTKPTITRGSTATGQTMDWVFFSQKVLFTATTAKNAGAVGILADVLNGADLIRDYFLD